MTSAAEKLEATVGPRVTKPRDTEPRTTVGESSETLRSASNDSRKNPPTSPEWEWAPPLDQFLGEHEPDDDDAEDWIIRDLIPRAEPFIFGGEWKSGKTWTAITIAVSIALGRPFLGFENTLGRPGRVLLIALEDSKRRLRKRVWQVTRGLGLTPNDETIRTHLRIWDNAIRIPGDKEVIKRFVAEQQRWEPDVIFVDSLSRAMTGSQNDIKDASAFTAVWRDMTIATGASIGFLHHTNKVSEDKRGRGTPDSFSKMRGSGELLAAPRNLIVMERLGTDDSKLSAVSMRGNLDLRRTSFALEYIQEERDGKIAVTLHDRGDVEAVVRANVDAKKTAKATEKQAKADRITRTALQIARDRGAVSMTTLGTILAVVPRTAGRYLDEIHERKLLGVPNEDGRPITKQGLAWLEERGA